MMFGKRLQELRVSRGLSQTELADLCGCTPATLSFWERGALVPTLASVRRLSEVLTVDMNWFKDGDLPIDRRKLWRKEMAEK